MTNNINLLSYKVKYKRKRLGIHAKTKVSQSNPPVILKKYRGQKNER
tara:strand:+ start:954 stop:1094 length:141 start_codon:yes stop_codon:yes gene_type:complete